MDAQLTYVERLLIRIICVLAFVIVGFSHKAPALAGNFGQTELSRYILPDGTLPTLCITSGSQHDYDDGQGSGHPASLMDCAACLCVSVILPQHAVLIGHRARFYPKANHGVDFDLPLNRLFPLNTGPRAPPMSLREFG